MTDGSGTNDLSQTFLILHRFDLIVQNVYQSAAQKNKIQAFNQIIFGSYFPLNSFSQTLVSRVWLN